MIQYDTINHLNPTNTMSSNIKVVKICEYCKKEFIAKTTTTACCSANCAKRFYTLKKREEKINKIVDETEQKRNEKFLISEQQIKLINVKRYLTLNEAAMLLNITPLTLRRWTLSGKIKANKIGKKWIFYSEYLEFNRL